MKIQLVPIAAALCCGLAFAAHAPAAPQAPPAPAAASASLNWLMDGGTNQRSGWQRGDTGITPANVGGLRLLWTVHTGNQARALHSLMAPLVVENVPTSDGPQEVVYVVGSSDNLYAIQTSVGKILWKRHFTYPALPSRFGFARPQPANPADLGFLGPGGSTDVPAIGSAAADGHRPIYVMDGGGFLHILDDVTGQAMKPKISMGVTSKFSLQLYKNQIIFVTGAGVTSVNVAEPGAPVEHTTNFAGGGGLWGRRGPAIDYNGTVWSTIGDGIVNTSNPNHLTLGDSVVGFAQQPDGSWKVKNWFTPTYWRWLQKRDLDWNNTPTIFRYDGRQLLVGAGKECRLYLLDPNDPGGPNHHVPLFRSPRFCNDMADFQNAGSWGALSSWVDASGTRWVIAPFWGPPSTETQFPIVNTPVAREGGEAAFKLTDTGGHLALEPAWVSQDMYRGDPPIITDGIVWGFAAGDNTQQAWPDIGLQFNSSIRAALSGHATIYALDAQTGKTLWSSGDHIKTFAHFSGLAVARGKVFLGTYDGVLYCFGLPPSPAPSN